ncbi:hypothetical protein RDABS01_016273 [Bienertia sinuspersici]
MQGSFPVEVVEAMSLRYGLRITLKDVLRSLTVLASAFKNVSFSFVRRGGNKVAHKLAGLSSKFEDLS